MHAYLKLVRDRFDFYGTWLPGSNVQVGEIGRLAQGGSFISTGSLTRRGQQEPPKRSQSEPPLQAMVGASVTMGAGASVEVGELVSTLAKPSASLTLKMATHNSAALVLDKVTRDQFEDEQVIRALMSEMRLQGRLELDEVVVTQVLIAKSGIVASSSAKDFGGSAGADAGVGVTELTLGTANGHIVIQNEKTSDTIRQAKRGHPLTPMYRALFFLGSRNWPRFWQKTLTVEDLVEAGASLRALRGAARSSRRAQSVYARAIEGVVAYDITGGYFAGEPGLLLSGSPDVVASSSPSLALAEHAINELGLADHGVEDFTVPLIGGGLRPESGRVSLGLKLRSRGYEEEARDFDTHFARVVDLLEGVTEPRSGGA